MKVTTEGHAYELDQFESFGLEESLMWLEKRTNDRKARSVEGKHLA